MSVKLMSAIFETEFRDLVDADGNVTKASTAKIVLLAMADHANDEGEGAYPGLTLMERKTALSRQAIINTYDALKFNGIIFLVGESKLGTNNYTINKFSFPKASDGSQPALLVNPVDKNSQPSLPVLVNSVDPNHPLTIQETSSEILKNSDPAWTILAGQDITEEQVKTVQLRDVAPRMFEKALGFSKRLPWWDGDKDWRELGEWVCAEYDKDKSSFGRYNTWRNTKYTKGGIANTRLRGFPSEFYDSWDMFKQSEGEHKTDEQRPEYQSIQPDTIQAVPNPLPKPRLP